MKWKSSMAEVRGRTISLAKGTKPGKGRPISRRQTLWKEGACLKRGGGWWWWWRLYGK